LLVYTFARAFDFLSVEIASLAVVLVAVLYGYYGAEAVKRLWFPIVYLCFMIPLPLWFIDGVTAPLKEFVSWAASGLLELVGYPIVRQGVTLYVAQYQLLVEDACAGLNSLVSLTAISLFYIYLLHNATWRYSLMLVAWIIPLAILANVIRIIILVLLTYHFGDAAAQGFLHSTAGLVMFATALLGIFLVDGATQAVQRRFGWGAHR
jgi:exosortase